MTASPLAPPPLLAVRGIAKSFPGVRALDKVSLSLRSGEVLCVVGENGAGKSTLMKILAGIYAADEGEIRLDGRPYHPATVAAAQRAGVILIHQELNLAPTLDVAGNLFLGREPRWGGVLRLIDRRIYADAREALKRVGLDCPPGTPVARLTIGQQQLVEIARALQMQSRVLIMDEPTSSLSQSETRRLFAVIGELKRQGVGVLYISHRLKEVEEVADRVVVLRDGRNAGELERREISHAALVRLMIGRELKQFFHRTYAPPFSRETSTAPTSGTVAPAAPLVLEVRGLRVTREQSRPIDFTIAAGEVVGMAGLVGAGRTELAEALFGLRPILAGEVRVDGRAVDLRTPRRAIAAGVLLVPEDRREHGLLLEQSVRRNVSLASLVRVSRLGLIRASRDRELAQNMCGQMKIRASSTEQTVGLLSGGNQQKVVLAKWLCRRPRLLILDEPTRGVDVGAKTEIYSLIDELTTRGVGILMISSDLEEILGFSDRVLVMHEGELAGELAREQLSEEAVMHLATGGRERT